MPPYLIALIVVVSTAAVFQLFCVFAVLTVYKKMFGYRFSHDPLITTYTPEGLGLEKREVEIELKGDMIRGGLYSRRGANADKSILVVLCHGMWGSHLSYMQEIGYLCDAGLEVLAFDYIGTSLSDGESLGGFGQSLRCLDRVIDYVKEDGELSGRKLWVYGHSWGGYAASNIVKLHPDITGIVAISPAASFDAVAKSVLPRGAHFLIPTVRLVEWMKMGKYANQSAVKSLRGYKGRALFIHSVDDPMCPYATTTGAIRSAFDGENFSYVILEDKEHNPQYTYEGLALKRAYFDKLNRLSTDAERDEHKRSTDFLSMGALDSEIMDKAVNAIKSE